jgi:Rrf2 family protein
LIRIQKTVEYALIALKHLHDAPEGALVSAKELSERYHLPYELVSKILQRLTAGSILDSQQGVRGGYRLREEADLLTFLDLSNLLTGPVRHAKCSTASDVLEERYSCNVFSTCTIVSPIADLGRRIETLFDGIRVFDLLDGSSPEANICCRNS